MKDQLFQAEPSDKYLLVQLGQHLFAIPLLSVQEVIEYQSAKSVANLPSYVEGLIRLRGDPVMSIELRKLIGVSSSIPRYRLVFLVKGNFMAAVVDNVLSVIVIERSEFEKGEWPFAEELVSFVEGKAQFNGKDVHVLNILQFMEKQIYETAQAN